MFGKGQHFGPCLFFSVAMTTQTAFCVNELKGLEVNKEIKTFLAAYPNWAEVVEGAAHFEFEIWGSEGRCLTPGCEESLHEVCEKRGVSGLRQAMTIIASPRCKETTVLFGFY